MNPEFLRQLLSQVTVLLVVKGMFLVGLLVYLAFAIIIVRQVGIMNEALEDPHNGVVKLFAWMHLVMTIMLLIVSFILL